MIIIGGIELMDIKIFHKYNFALIFTPLRGIRTLQ